MRRSRLSTCSTNEVTSRFLSAMREVEGGKYTLGVLSGDSYAPQHEILIFTPSAKAG